MNMSALLRKTIFIPKTKKWKSLVTLFPFKRELDYFATQSCKL